MVVKKKRDYVDMGHDYKLRCLEISTYNKNIVEKNKEKEVINTKKVTRLPKPN